VIIQDNIFFKSITSFQLLAKFHLNFVVNTLQTKNDILKGRRNVVPPSFMHNKNCWHLRLALT